MALVGYLLWAKGIPSEIPRIRDARKIMKTIFFILDPPFRNKITRRIEHCAWSKNKEIKAEFHGPLATVQPYLHRGHFLKQICCPVRIEYPASAMAAQFSGSGLPGLFAL